MRRDNNPCWKCEKARGGCGKHAECEKYLAFHEENKMLSKKRAAKCRLDDYTTKEIQKCKARGCHGTFKKYRPA